VSFGRFFGAGGRRLRGTIVGICGTVRKASAAALTVTRLAAAATATRWAAWARKGPATEPMRVAAASPVRNTALTRLARALGMRLVITLIPDEDRQQAREPAPPEMPASLVRLGRAARFRQAVTTIATALDLDPDQFSAQLVTALATLAHTMGQDLAEADW
jgi:hypothetical protein